MSCVFLTLPTSPTQWMNFFLLELFPTTAFTPIFSCDEGGKNRWNKIYVNRRFFEASGKLRRKKRGKLSYEALLTQINEAFHWMRRVASFYWSKLLWRHSVGEKFSAQAFIVVVVIFLDWRCFCWPVARALLEKFNQHFSLMKNRKRWDKCLV